MLSMYLSLMAFLCIGIVCLTSTIKTWDVLPIIVTWTICMAFILLNCLYQVYLISQAHSDRILSPVNIEKVCSVQQLMYEIKSSHRRVFILLTW